MCAFLMICTGNAVRRNMKKRARFLHKLCLFMTLFKPRVQYLHEPIYKTVKVLSKNSQLSELLFLCQCTTDYEGGTPFPKAWETAVKDIPSYELKAEDARLLCSFGESVSSADSHDISAVISLYEAFLCERSQSEQKEAERDGKMCMSIFSAIGILLAIIII